MSLWASFSENGGSEMASRKAIQVLDASGNPLDGRVFLAPTEEVMSKMVVEYALTLPAGSSWFFCEESEIQMPAPVELPEV